MYTLSDAYRRLTEVMETGGEAYPPVEFTQDGDILTRSEARDTSRGGATDAAAIVRTSGSTGTPKQTVLTTSGLVSSAKATEEFIGGAGQWLVGLSPNYVAGLAMLSRSVVAGIEPVTLPSGHFSAEKFCAGASALGASFRQVSLVPTQLARLLDNPSPATLDALHSFDAILLGGARVPDELKEKIGDLPVFTTYGMSETSGGCVYNGKPLPGVTIEFVEYDAGERIQLTGPMVAAGYLDNPELTTEHFSVSPEGTPRFLTDDIGTFTDRLSITGRIDDVINTGGVKVSATVIAQRLESHPSVREAFVTGIPDTDWGEKVCAALTLTDGTDTLSPALQQELTALLKDELGAPAVPKIWRAYSALPLLPNGKTDRGRLKAAFE